MPLLLSVRNEGFLFPIVIWIYQISQSNIKKDIIQLERIPLYLVIEYKKNSMQSQDFIENMEKLCREIYANYEEHNANIERVGW